jgi:hypothetical protein
MMPNSPAFKVVETTALQVMLDNGDLFFGLRLDPGHHGATDQTGRRQHSLKLAERRCTASTLRVAPRDLGHLFPVAKRLIGIERGVWHHAKNAAFQLSVETVHDGEHGDQHGHSQHQPENGRQGDEGDEVITALGSRVTQAYK